MENIDQLVDDCYDVIGRYQSYELENESLSLGEFEGLLQTAECLLPELDMAIKYCGEEAHAS